MGVTVRKNLRYDGERNEYVEALAEILAQNPDKDVSNQIEKCNMIGGYLDHYKEVVRFGNGVSIMEFDSDGLVDYEEDWTIHDSEDGPDRVYRIYGLSDEISKRNYGICVRYPYGIVELSKIMPYYEADYDSPSEDTEYDVSCQLTILDKHGNIILDRYDTPDTSGEGYSWLRNEIMTIRKAVLDHIINNGPDREWTKDRKFTDKIQSLLNKKKDFEKKPYFNFNIRDKEFISRLVYELWNNNEFAQPHCINNINNKYQLMFMGDLNSDDDMFAYALFDMETGKCIANNIGMKPIALNEKKDTICLPELDGVILFGEYLEDIHKIKIDTSCLEYLEESDEDELSNDVYLKITSGINHIEHIALNMLESVKQDVR